MSVYVKRSVPLAPFQERFRQMEAAPAVRTGKSPKDAGTRIAERLGWYTPRGSLDSPRVRRTLGLRPTGHRIDHRNGVDIDRPPTHFKTVRYEMALRLCEAMDMDFHEVDL